MIEIEGINHVVTVQLHNVAKCLVAQLRGGFCNTVFEISCSCGFIQGTDHYDNAEKIAAQHIDDPEMIPIVINKSNNLKTIFIPAL